MKLPKVKKMKKNYQKKEMKKLLENSKSMYPALYYNMLQSFGVDVAGGATLEEFEDIVMNARWRKNGCSYITKDLIKGPIVAISQLPFYARLTVSEDKFIPLVVKGVKGNWEEKKLAYDQLLRISLVLDQNGRYKPKIEEISFFGVQPERSLSEKLKDLKVGDVLSKRKACQKDFIYARLEE